MKTAQRKTAKCKECGIPIYPTKRSKICWDCYIKKVKKYYGEPIKQDGTLSKDRNYLARKEWSKRNKDKDTKAKQKWIKNNPERRKEVVREYEKRNPEKRRMQVKRHALKYPEKIKARNQTRYIKKGDKCIFCGNKKDLEKHHPNYSKPKFIITLCRICHKKLHLKNGNWATI